MYNWLSLSTIRKYEPEMERLSVSKIARSRTGFLSQYKRAKGNWRNLSDYWIKKRNAFIARHLAQYKKDRGYRRRLALIAWAYDPE